MERTNFTPLKLSNIGLDEFWIKDQVVKDTAILGLGNLSILCNEAQHQLKGRTDILLYDHQSSIGYKIEITLGHLDESYLINSLDYWRVEKEIFPALEYRVAIVAEDIDPNLFNTIKLMYKPTSIVLIQCIVFKDRELIKMEFQKVLDSVKLVNESSLGNKNTIGKAGQGFSPKLRSNEMGNLTLDAFESASFNLDQHNYGGTGWGI